jgi:hypothetical protein
VYFSKPVCISSAWGPDALHEVTAAEVHHLALPNKIRAGISWAKFKPAMWIINLRRPGKVAQFWASSARLAFHITRLPQVARGVQLRPEIHM